MSPSEALVLVIEGRGDERWGCIQASWGSFGAQGIALVLPEQLNTRPSAKQGDLVTW